MILVNGMWGADVPRSQPSCNSLAKGKSKSFVPIPITMFEENKDKSVGLKTDENLTSLSQLLTRLLFLHLSSWLQYCQILRGGWRLNAILETRFQQQNKHKARHEHSWRLEFEPMATNSSIVPARSPQIVITSLSLLCSIFAQILSVYISYPIYSSFFCKFPSCMCENLKDRFF